jgi:hypothetical protein
MLLGLPHLEVAGWGGIYSHQPNYSRWKKAAGDGCTGQSGAPPHHPLDRVGAGRPLEALSSCGTGQSGVTPDSPVPL